jgi:membrane protease YdiL (CAAX protease family)
MTTEQWILLIKRLILGVLTIVAIASVTLSLLQSLGQPQIQSRLELYQTNLLLHASEWQGKSIPQESKPDLKAARNALLGDKPLKTALEQYQDARKSAQTSQSNITAQLKEVSEKLAQLRGLEDEDAPTPDELKIQLQRSKQQQQLQGLLSQVKQLIDELDLRIGLLQAQQGDKAAALKTWNQFTPSSAPGVERVSVPKDSIVQTAQVLIGLWSEPSRLLPDAEPQIQKNLDGWFRYRALAKLYQLQQNQDALLSLQAKEQGMAEQALFKLALIGGIPGVGSVLGVGLLIFLIVQRLLQGKQSLLATNSEAPWETPWNWEIIWQVFILGFFFIGQLLLPTLFHLLGINPGNYDVRMKAFYVLVSYILLASGGFLVLYFSLKPFFPLPEDWFRFKWRSNWILWGLGGYFVALPLVILVSLFNQELWQGQGGSNPILPLALEGRDSVAIFLFCLTACVAAPMFEEIFFRGFLLPSLTRYLPVWGAIIVSGFVFALAHLSFSEVLPLATLGIVLGIVYTRSRNLLASMLLHGLWNAGTLLSLFVLGSGSH